MKQLLISLKTPNRAAVVENGRLEELFVSNERDTVGNVYRGRVVRIEPVLNAAFVDIGSARAAFLAVDDICAISAPGNTSLKEAPATPSGVAGGGQPRPSISDLLRPGQDLMVQVTKASRQQRGAVVSTLLSIPGRYLVMTNVVEGVALSRKISGRKERQRLMQIVRRMVPPAAVIVRDAAVDRSREDIGVDLANLNQLWQGSSTSSTAAARHQISCTTTAIW